MGNSDKTQNTSTVSTYRSPTFSRAEVHKLVDLVAEHKKIILNKSTQSVINIAKENTWMKIADTFNQEPSFENERNWDCLKTKWENLKKSVRKVHRNDIKNYPDDLTMRVADLLDEADSDKSAAELNEESDVNEQSNNDWDDSMDKLTEETKELTGHVRDRSTNFSTNDSRLLLKCIREEKDIIFSLECTQEAKRLKNHTWISIANRFNSESEIKRTSKCLRNKFKNMKKLARNGSFKSYIKELGVKKHKKLVNEYSKDIKKELDFNDSHDDGFNDFRNDVHGDDNDNLSSDPLSTVLNGDAAVTCSTDDSREVDRLKIELLRYQLETAKMERQRVKDQMEAEAAERESRSIETALRLRTARLDAVMAEMRLPPSHPALVYTAAEVRAQPYLSSGQ